MTTIHALAAVALSLALAQIQEPPAPVADPHGHLVDVHAGEWSVDLAPKANMVEVDYPGFTDRGDLVYSPESLWAACTVRVAVDSMVLDRIEFARVIGAESVKVMELAGLPLPHRPLTDLAWVDERWLVFDRWSTPHYGIHYVLDAREAALAHAAPFADSIYLHSVEAVSADSLSPGF